jgi:hypothetical protein
MTAISNLFSLNAGWKNCTSNEGTLSTRLQELRDDVRMIYTTLFPHKYPGREVWIEVSEDGENGSFIKY